MTERKTVARVRRDDHTRAAADKAWYEACAIKMAAEDAPRLRRSLRAIGCFFGAHTGGVLLLGAATGRFGLRCLYQCKRCRRYFSEKW